jgi:hypothetical protein
MLHPMSYNTHHEVHAIKVTQLIDFRVLCGAFTALASLPAASSTASCCANQGHSTAGRGLAACNSNANAFNVLGINL